jgi:ribosomal protein L14
MLFKGSFCRVLDNSGARLVKCIHIFRFRVARPGVRVMITIRDAVSDKKVKKGDVFAAVVAQAVRPYPRFSRVSFSFLTNSVVLLKKGDTVPLSSRIPHFVSEEVKTRGYYKISSLALGVYLTFLFILDNV